MPAGYRGVSHPRSPATRGQRQRALRGLPPRRQGRLLDRASRPVRSASHDPPVDRASEDPRYSGVLTPVQQLVKPRRPTYRRAAGTLGLLLLLAACGGGAASTTTVAPSTTVT